MKSLSTNQTRFLILFVFFIGLIAGFLDFPQIWDRGVDFINAKAFGLLGWKIPHFPQKPFRLGLDLQGGSHLVYRADLSNIKPEEYSSAMAGLRDVIERRVNLFGIAEPIVQTAKYGDEHQLIVELAGIKDVEEAIKMIGETPYLEFKKPRPEAEREDILKRQKEGDESVQQEDPYFLSSGLSGRQLVHSEVSLDQNTYKPQVNLKFNDEGKRLFGELTGEFVGQQLAIYLDGLPISVPRVNEPIYSGEAVITGSFTPEEAKQLAGRLNSGALPVPITLIAQQTVGPILGKISLTKSLEAGIIGFILVILFMLCYYRLPGLLAGFSLFLYVFILLAIFKLIPVTLTLAGIAGFVLSIGMAVDANVLIFERMKEELEAGKSLMSAVDEGVRRAWSSIRDGNLSTLFTAVVLYWFGTSIIRGFALTLAIGILVSMFSAIIVTKALLKLIGEGRIGKWQKFWE